MFKKFKLSIGAKISILITLIVISATAIISFVSYKKVLHVVYESEIYAANSQFVESVNQLKTTFGFLVVVILFITIGFSILISKSITSSITSLKEYIRLMEEGILPNEIVKDSEDEIGEMAVIMNNVTQSLKRTAQFAHDIGEGNLKASFQPLSHNDVLGNSLINMQQSILLADKREKERAWIVDGVADVGEILRRHTRLDALSYDVIKYLIGRLRCVQGAFYTVEDDDDSNSKVIVMKNCYAYDRKKYLTTKFKFGVGLVGQSAIEKATVYRKEIPSSYCNITSGLIKDKKPSSVLIVPLIKDEEIFGLVELASLYEINDNEIKYVEEVGPIIARTIFNIFVNERTQKHLEQSQIMSHELQQQQEELRQNAEEMRATQEDLQKANQQLEEQIQEVNRTQQRIQSLLENASEVITIYEKDGRIRYISPSVLSILGIESNDLIGVRDEVNIHQEDVADFKDLFRKLIVNPAESLTIQYRYKKKTGDWMWLEATGKNLLEDPAVKGIVLNSRDITLKRKAEVEERMRKNMQALSENSPDLITRISSDGVIAYTNPTIESYTGLKSSEFLNKQVDGSTMDNEFLKSWNLILQEVKDTKLKLHKEIQYTSAILGSRIMKVNAIPEYNDTSIESVLVVSHDITEMKKIEVDIQAKNKNIQESITYSKRIQNAIIPDNNIIQKCFPESFILYKPKDIVSGDFPWFMQKGDDVFLAVVDCTGHGVPGAMLSLVGYFQLNNIVDAHPEMNPAEILDALDHKVNDALIKNTNEENIKDGMDIALCKINIKKKTIEYSGAHRALYQLNSKAEIEEYKGDKWAIGGGVYKNQTTFKNYKIDIKKGDSFFFFSDGFPDQFGGTENRKFGTSRIKDIILKGNGKPLTNSFQMFLSEFDAWKGKGKQTDDVLLIGLKF